MKVVGCSARAGRAKVERLLVPSNGPECCASGTPQARAHPLSVAAPIAFRLPTLAQIRDTYCGCAIRVNDAACPCSNRYAGSASRSEHTQGRGMPREYRHVSRSAPASGGTDSARRRFVPLASAIRPVRSHAGYYARRADAVPCLCEVHHQCGYYLSVADTGSGIDPQHRARIFEPFFTTKGEKGSGLGLWVCAGIVNRVGGSMRVWSSRRPGRSGTCFSVFLPAKEATFTPLRRRYERGETLLASTQQSQRSKEARPPHNATNSAKTQW